MTSMVVFSWMSSFSYGMQGKFKIIFSLLFTVFFAPLANAATYYVSTSGNDSNSGSISSPWRTLGKAANTLVAGDIVNIRGGVYKEQVTPRNSGYAGAFITYTAYPGESVTVDGSNGFSYAWNGLFDLRNRSYIEVSGLRLFNSPGFGVLMSSSSNIRLLKNYTSNTFYSGFYAENSNYITVDRNEVELANRGKNQESISMSDTQNYVVSNNRVHGGYMEGIDAKGRSSNGKIFGNTVYNMTRVGIYVDSWDETTENIEIYNNSVSNSQTGNSGASEDGIRIGGERNGTANNIKVYNNIIYNISQSGIIIANWTEFGGAEPKFNNISIYNNTVYNSGLKSGGGIQIQGTQNSGVAIRNNIVSRGGSFSIQAPSSVAVSNNLYDGGSPSGTSAVVGNPLFVSAGSDFHLQSTSPAINTGTTTGAPTIDYDQKARPQGGQVDIGAYEFGSTTAPAPQPAPAPTATPAPAPAPAPAPVPSTSNIARYASVTASSQNTGTGQQAAKAIDGVIDGIGGKPGDYTREWATYGQKAGAWIQLKWSASHKVSQVILYDRPNLDDQITSAVLTFSDGSKVYLGTLNNNGGAVVINFTPRVTRSVKLTVRSTSGTTLNIGLSEFQVIGN